MASPTGAAGQSQLRSYTKTLPSFLKVDMASITICQDPRVWCIILEGVSKPYCLL